MTEAFIGYGARFQTLDQSTSPDSWIDSGEVIDLNLPPLNVDSIDCSAECKPGEWREYLPGLKNSAEVTVNHNYTQEQYSRLYDDANNRTIRLHRILFPVVDSEPVAADTYFDGFIVALEVPLPIADRVTITARYKVTGDFGQDD